MQFSRVRDLSDSELRLLFYLSERAEQNPSYKMTTATLATESNCGEGFVLSALDRLQELGHIDRTKSTITRVGDINCSLKFTNSKDRQTDSLLRENEELKAALKEALHDNYSELSSLLRNEDHAATVEVCEDVLGRTLRSDEIWYLATLVARVPGGAPRVRKALNQQANAKNPLKATFSILMKQSKGKQIGDGDEAPIEQWIPDDKYNPWKE